MTRVHGNDVAPLSLRSGRSVPNHASRSPRFPTGVPSIARDGVQVDDPANSWRNAGCAGLSLSAMFSADTRSHGTDGAARCIPLDSRP